MYTPVIVFLLLATSSLGVPRRRSLGGKIIGGEETEIENYPYQLSLEYFFRHNCGASIISPEWALTAAHCVEKLQLIIVRFRAGSSIRGQGGTLHQAIEKILHPQYDNYTIDYDIAVVKVREPFVYGPAVQPISLATTEPATGDKVTITGWGRISAEGELSSHLKVAFLEMLDHKECVSDYIFMYTVTKNMICAAADQPGQDSCEADSGGPMVVAGKQAGIISWGEGCGEPRYPGVYTNVALLRDFVVTNTGIE